MAHLTTITISLPPPSSSVFRFLNDDDTGIIDDHHRLSSTPSYYQPATHRRKTPSSPGQRQQASVRHRCATVGKVNGSKKRSADIGRLTSYMPTTTTTNRSPYSSPAAPGNSAPLLVSTGGWPGDACLSLTLLPLLPLFAEPDYYSTAPDDDDGTDGFDPFFSSARVAAKPAPGRDSGPAGSSLGIRGLQSQEVLGPDGRDSVSDDGEEEEEDTADDEGDGGEARESQQEDQRGRHHRRHCYYSSSRSRRPSGGRENRGTGGQRRHSEPQQPQQMRKLQRQSSEERPRWTQFLDGQPKRRDSVLDVNPEERRRRERASSSSSSSSSACVSSSASSPSSLPSSSSPSSDGEEGDEEGREEKGGGEACPNQSRREEGEEVSSSSSSSSSSAKDSSEDNKDNDGEDDDDDDADVDTDHHSDRYHDRFVRTSIEAQYRASRLPAPKPVDAVTTAAGPESVHDWHRQDFSPWWRNDESDSDSDPGTVIRLPPVPASRGRVRRGVF